MTDQELQKQQEELQKQRDHEADLQRLRGFRPIDDTFMRCIYQDNIPLAEMVEKATGFIPEAKTELLYLLLVQPLYYIAHMGERN